MPKCIILQGMPCSGKSSWIKKHCPIDSQGYKYKVFSCDVIRQQMFGKKYKHNNTDELRVWKTFYTLIDNSVMVRESFIVDNTNLKQHYINQIMCCLTDNYEVEIKKFSLSLWKAQLRNYLRLIKTGKYIPNKVLKNFYKRAKNLNN